MAAVSWLLVGQYNTHLKGTNHHNINTNFTFLFCKIEQEQTKISQKSPIFFMGHTVLSSELSIRLTERHKTGGKHNLPWKGTYNNSKFHTMAL